MILTTITTGILTAIPEIQIITDIIPIIRIIVDRVKILPGKYDSILFCLLMIVVL